MTRARDWLSLGEASRALGIHPDTLRRWADTGEVPVFVTPGRHRRFARGTIGTLGPRSSSDGGAPLALDRLILEYCAAGERETRGRLLRLAEHLGETLGMEAREDGRSLGQAIAPVLDARARLVARAERMGDAVQVRDANAAFDRVLVGMASSRSRPARS